MPMVLASAVTGKSPPWGRWSTALFSHHPWEFSAVQSLVSLVSSQRQLSSEAFKAYHCTSEASNLYMPHFVNGLEENR